MNKKIRNLSAILYATVLMLSITQTLPISMANANMTLTLSKHIGNVGEEILFSGREAPLGIIQPEVVLNPIIGLPDETVTINGTGFAAEKAITVAFGNKTVTGKWDWSMNVTTVPTKVKTDDKGSFTCRFKVPNVDYGDYIVNATDESGNMAEADFTIGAIITLTPTEGASGTLVNITGRGFTQVAGKAIRVTIDGTPAPMVADIKTKSDGTFTGRFILPTIDEGEYTVTATDENGISSNLPFYVTRKTGIRLIPRAGAPDIGVTIEGTDFTNIADTKVTVKFENLTLTLTIKDFYTSSNGEFKGTFDVPSLENGVYNVTATDANGLNATAPFMITVTSLALEPESGTTGTLVNIIGYGFMPGAKADMTLDTWLIKKNINVTELETGITFIVPTIPVGVYSVTVIDDEGLSASATFEVTETTTIIVTPDRTTYKASVSVEARYFTQQAGTPLTFTIQNSTWDGVILAEVETDETGSYEGTFEIPDYGTIAPGDYIVKAEDENGLEAEAPITIIFPIVYMGTRSSEYMPGDTVSFYVNSTFKCDFKIRIIGLLGFIEELTVSDTDWQTIDNWEVVPCEKVSFTLPSDAEPGVWNWSVTLIAVEASGSFTVIKLTLEKLNEEIILLRDKVSSLERSLSPLSEDVSSLSKKLDEISSKVDALSEESLSSLRNDIDNLRRELDTLKNHVSEAEEAARSAQQTASNLTTTIYIVLAISIAAAVAATLAFIAIIELGRMVTEGLKL